MEPKQIRWHPMKYVDPGFLVSELVLKRMTQCYHDYTFSLTKTQINTVKLSIARSYLNQI